VDSDDARRAETEQEVVELTPRQRRVPGWLLVVAVLVVLGGLARLEQGKNPSTATPAPPSSPSRSAIQFGSTSPPVEPSPSPVRPVVVNLGRQLLGVTAGWELYVRRADEVVRIQLALGRVTRTPVPTLASGSAVTFVAVSGGVVVRPWDNVPGYFVRDGEPARPVDAASGQVFPGPVPDELWAMDADGRALSSIGLDGGLTGRSIRLPAADQWWPVAADGAGSVIVRGIGGDYVARPDGLHRISTGNVVAVGRTGWLAVECDARARCATVAIDRRTGARRHLGVAPVGSRSDGLIAPDGSFAVVYAFNRSSVAIHLVDLASGADHRLDVALSPDVPVAGTLAWSPDSRWLFAISGGQVVAIDLRTRAVRSLEVLVQIGEADQLAVWPGGR